MSLRLFGVGSVFKIIIIATTGSTLNAQQEQLNSQYMFNTQSINPAYAGTWESVGFTILTGQQWDGFEGAPQSYTFSMQAPLSNKNSGLGLNIVNDKIGFEKRFCTFADYSYLIKVNKTTKLRLGVKGGFTSYSGYDNNDLLKSEQITPEFQERSRKSILNAGIGAFLYNKKYYVGFSVPKIIKNKSENDLRSFAPVSENQHYYLMSGLIFNLGRNLKFKPTTMAIASLASTDRPTEINLAANFLVKEKLWFGAMFRTNNAYGFMAQMIFKGNLRLGYAYDILASNLNNQHNSSHNLMVSYELASLKNSFGSPRYF